MMSEAAPEAPATTAADTAEEPVATRKDWQAEAEKWKALARKHEDVAKSNAQKASEFDKLTDAQRTAEERATARAEAAEARAKEATERAVKAEIKSIATGEFAVPERIHLLLGDLTKFVDKSGDVDSAAIEAALKELEKEAPELIARARTDAGLGARGGNAPQSASDFMNQQIRQAAGR